MPPVIAAELVVAWSDIQRAHPDLPNLVAPESLIEESSTACGAGYRSAPTFLRLLHEAAHALASARGVRETSRGGRYHNRKFLALAEELGLRHLDAPHGTSGFSLVTLRPETRRRYAATIERLHQAISRHEAVTRAAAASGVAETSAYHGPAARYAPSGGGVRVKAVCACGRILRVVPSVLDQAPILCGGCGKQFRLVEQVARA